VGFFLGMWDYRPSWMPRFFFSAQGMIAHYPKQRAYTELFFDPDTPARAAMIRMKTNLVRIVVLITGLISSWNSFYPLAWPTTISSSIIKPKVGYYSPPRLAERYGTHLKVVSPP